MRASLLLAAAFVLPAPLFAQQAPPAPLEMREVEFPAFEERTLSSGARLLVVPQDEVPFVTINLVLPGGTVSDPTGREGTASFASQLLTRGTTTRSAEEIAEAIDFLGASLSASSSQEWTTVGLASLTSTLDEALALMADVVLNPSFPDDEVELLRTRSLSGLQVALSQAGTLASREFTRLLYGAHPYGRLETPASIEAVTRDNVAAFHDTWFRPGGALFVVAGAVDADGIAAALDDAFRGWTPASVPAVEFPAAPTRSRPEIVVVHKPGTVQAEVRVGHLLPGGDFDGATALNVANQILGGGSSGRLFKVLREERGYTYGAYSSVGRARQASTFEASTAVRTEVAGEAVQELLNLVEALRTEVLPADELADTQAFLTGVFPLRIETAQQVAGQVTTNRLLGLPEDAIETYRSRVAALDTATVREVAAELIRPEQLVVVVAGDAAALQPQLLALGSVRIVDAEGAALTMADLAPKSASQTFDASGIMPMTLTYDVLVQGNPFGEMVRTIERTDAGLRAAMTLAIGPQNISQQVVVADDLSLVEASSEMLMGPQSMTMNAAREGDRVIGEMAMGAEAQAIDVGIEPGAIPSEAVELALWVAELVEGGDVTLAVINFDTGSTENLTVQVAGREEITVPAGTYMAWRLEVTGSSPQVIWVSDEAPRVTLKVEPAGQPVAFALKSIVTGG